MSHWPSINKFTLFVSLVFLASNVFAENRPTLPSDLAIVLEPSVFPQNKVEMKPPYFLPQWYEASLSLYENSPVGQALTYENSADDWQLVAVRIAPCQPLIPIISDKNSDYCAAEIRLIWQPIVFSRPGRWVGLADDRAFHATYRMNASTLLRGDQATSYQKLQQKVLEQVGSQNFKSPLADGELRLYTELHKSLVSELLSEVKDLRAAPQGDLVEVRAEYSTDQSRNLFSARLKEFLKKHALASQLVEITGFSLPEGRDPPLLDEWVFIALEPEEHRFPLDVTVKPKDILMKSRNTGKTLLNFGAHTTASMHRDDDRIFDMIEALNPEEQKEVSENAILRFSDKNLKKTLLSDVKQLQVPHTTCASCHKINVQPFDFHNLSYFVDHPVTISPRVVRDVEHDLSWLKSRGLL